MSASYRSLALWSGLLALAAVWGAVPQTGWTQEARTRPSSSTPPPDELRALVLAAPHPALSQAAEADRMIDTARKARFNAIVVPARVLADAYYKSQTEPAASGISPRLPDPLRYILDKAHEKPPASEEGAQELKVLVTFETLRAHSRAISALPQAGSILHRHPNWVTLNADNKAVDKEGYLSLDPAMPAVQEYLQAVLAELLKDYNVDGVILEGLRYPESNAEWGYHPEALRLYYAKVGGLPERPAPGDPKWVAFRKERLATLVKGLTDTARQTRPECQVFVGAEVIDPAPVNAEAWPSHPVAAGMLQDWVAWGREGIPDWILLKNFQREFQQGDDYRAWIVFVRQAAMKSKVAGGVAGGLNFSMDVTNQIQRVQAARIPGIVLYDYRRPTMEDRDFLFSRLRDSVFTGNRPLIGLLDAPRKRPTAASQTPTTATLASGAVTTGTLAPAAPAAPVMDTTTTLLLRERFHRAQATPPPTPTPLPVTPTPSRLLQVQPSAPKVYVNYRLDDGTSFRGRFLLEVNGMATFETEEGMQVKIPKARVVSPPLP